MWTRRALIMMSSVSPRRTIVTKAPANRTQPPLTEDNDNDDIWSEFVTRSSVVAWISSSVLCAHHQQQQQQRERRTFVMLKLWCIPLLTTYYTCGPSCAPKITEQWTGVCCRSSSRRNSLGRRRRFYIYEWGTSSVQWKRGGWWALYVVISSNCIHNPALNGHNKSIRIWFGHRSSRLLLNCIPL